MDTGNCPFVFLSDRSEFSSPQAVTAGNTLTCETHKTQPTSDTQLGQGLHLETQQQSDAKMCV